MRITLLLVCRVPCGDFSPPVAGEVPPYSGDLTPWTAGRLGEGSFFFRSSSL